MSRMGLYLYRDTYTVQVRNQPHVKLFALKKGEHFKGKFAYMRLMELSLRHDKIGTEHA